MRTVIDQAIQDGCCTFSNKIEIIFDDLEKGDLEDIIQFQFDENEVEENRKDGRGGKVRK